MSFALLGLGLALALFAAGAAGLSLVVALAFPTLERASHGLEPRARASLLFGLGMLPAVGGAVLAVGLVLPAWLAHEPREAEEQAGPVLLFLASVGILLVLVRFGAALGDVLRTERTVNAWIAAGQPLAGLPLPATRFPHAFPVAALAGWRRPRLLLADRLLGALSPAELEAVVAHELSHLEARDNLKRLLLRAAPDPLAFFGAGARLRRAFEEAAEAAADATAARRVSPLGLAQALMAVAALVPPGQRLELSVATVHREGSLATRVRALLRAHDGEGTASGSRSWPRRAAGVVALAVFFLLMVGSSTLPVVHRVLEGLVHLPS